MQMLGWFSIVRLGLVQTALGSIVVLTTSTLNRVMVVELLLPAMLPGILVGLHSALQISRPMWGHASDTGGRRSPWIIAGMAVLAAGGSTAALATQWMSTSPLAGIALAVLAYTLVGLGVGAAGTSLLALLAARVDPGRKAAAASIVWLMMIFGFVVTTATAGHLLEPFSFSRLVSVCSGVSFCAFIVSVLALYGLEGRRGAATAKAGGPSPSFRAVFSEVWADPDARAFTIFVFVAMLAYNTQDLILEPFAGAVFGLTPGESTKLTSVQHSGVLVGMLLVAFAASGRDRPRFGSAKAWTIAGCLLSGAILFALAISPWLVANVEGGGLALSEAASVAFVIGAGPGVSGLDGRDVVRALVAVMGFANGAFAVAAIGWMMSLASAGGSGREGIRMGLWGGAQAIAFAIGGFAGTLGVDVVRYTVGSTALPYAVVFIAEGILFFAAAGLAKRMAMAKHAARATDFMAASLSPEEMAPADYGWAEQLTKTATATRPSRVGGGVRQ